MNILGYIFVALGWFVMANWTYRQLRYQVREFGAQVGVYVPDWVLNIASFIPLVWPLVIIDYIIRPVKVPKKKSPKQLKAEFRGNL